MGRQATSIVHFVNFGYAPKRKGNNASIKPEKREKERDIYRGRERKRETGRPVPRKRGKRTVCEDVGR